MDTTERLEAFGNFIGKELSVKEMDVSNLLNLVGNSNPCSNIKCNFFLISCDADKVREIDFLKSVQRKVIPYALKKAEYENPSPDDIIDIAHKAINKFTMAERSGELGELILYFLLEGFEGAIQVINKMGLKTNPNMHYHGLDGVHFGIKNGNPTLYYGEAKMHKRHRKAIQEGLNTIQTFYNTPKKEDFEIDVVSSHIDYDKFGIFKEDLLNLLNPYYSNKDTLKTTHAIFLGYDWKKLCVGYWEKEESLQEYLKLQYKTELEKISNVVEEEMNKLPSIKPYHFNIYLIPFSDIDNARDTFRRLLRNE